MSVTKEKRSVYWIKVIIAVFLMFSFGYLPPIYPLETLGMQVLGIFLGLLFSWTFIGFVWPSLMALVALGLTSYGTMKSVFLTGFGDEITIFVFMMAIFTAYLDEVGLMKKIAISIISMKFASGRPWMLTYLIIFATYVMAAIAGVFPAIFLMWEVFYNMCDVVGYKKGDRYPAYIVCGIAIAAMLGITTLPFKAVPIMVFGALEKASDGTVTIDFLKFTIVSVIVSFLTLTAYFLLCKFILRLDVTPLKKANKHFIEGLGNGNRKFTQEQKIGLLALVAFILILFLPSLLPETNIIGITASKLGMVGTLTCILVIYSIFSFKGEKIIDIEKYARSHHVNWSMVFMFAGTMPVAGALSNQDVGILKLMTYYMGPVLQNVSPTMVAILLFFVALLMTQLVHNVVMAVIIIPVAYEFAIQMNIEVVPLAILIAFALGCAMITPAASGPAALMYLNKEWITTKQAYVSATLTVLCAAIVALLVGWPLVNVLF